MPELLRLITPEFEFSIWANDIRARAQIYQATLAKRAALDGELLPTLKFTPALNLTASAEPSDLALPDDATPLHTLSLPAPLFFENTLYQFEWVFFGPVTQAELQHRRQALNAAFRFSPARGR
ncbi:MAG: restriction endonuclease-like protein, partial [Shewanella sp.]